MPKVTIIYELTTSHLLNWISKHTPPITEAHNHGWLMHCMVHTPLPNKYDIKHDRTHVLSKYNLSSEWKCCNKSKFLTTNQN